MDALDGAEKRAAEGVAVAEEALWMDNPVKQDAYNLHILHRRGTKKAKDEAPGGTSEPEAKA